MDEYLLEIEALRRRIARLKFQRAPIAIIEELEAQLRILKAIYDATWELYAAGEADAGLRGRLRDRDLGSWTFENVYFYVYDEATKLEPDGHDLASRISQHPYRTRLLGSSLPEAATGT